MDYIRENKWLFLIIILLLLGLFATLYLVQVKQIFKSKASWNMSSSLDMDNQTQQMVEDESKNNSVPTYTVSGDKVRVKLKDNTVENINQALESQVSK
ncbi:hypothetical protein HYW41_00255 [Candidatus Daviesbacteria bacterium]|nr:hypothetical protein [Candidatus Daviesbacteria bacterium]